MSAVTTTPATILEGTWEEILQHASQLAGHRLQIKILDPAPTANGSTPHQPSLDTSPEARAKWFEEFKKSVQILPPLGPWDDSRDTVYEHLLK